MPIKNYTSQVPAKRSIDYIETQLVKHGARTIVKLYDENKIINGIWFVMSVDGKDIPFKLPARIKECEIVLKSNLGPRARSDTYKKIPKQAEMTAWKILSDWIEAEMAMIELGQRKITEAFLSCIYDQKNDQTFYEKVKDNFKNLITYE